MPFRHPLLFLGLAILLAAAASLHAQGTPPPLPAGPAFPSSPGTPAPERPGTRLMFPNAQVTEILEQYELLTGKRVIADQKVTASINLVVNTPVTRSEAIKIIEVALTLNGYTLVAEGDIIKVLGLGTQARQNGVPIYTDLSLVPDSDQIVAYLVRLRYLDPLETAGVLQQFIPGTTNVAFIPSPRRARCSSPTPASTSSKSSD